MRVGGSPRRSKIDAVPRLKPCAPGLINCKLNYLATLANAALTCPLADNRVYGNRNNDLRRLRFYTNAMTS